MNVTGAWRMALGLLVAACIALSPSLAYAEDESPAYEIFDNYLSQSNSVAEFNNYLINDLANRWFYADATKRTSVPVIQSAWTNVDGSLEYYLEESGGNPSDAAYKFSTCQAIVSYVDAPLLPSQLYKLVTLDNGLAWDSSSMRAREYYRAWYEWFEGAPSVDVGFSPTITVYGAGGSGYYDSAWRPLTSSDTLTVQFTQADYQSTSNWMASNGITYWRSIATQNYYNSLKKSKSYFIIYSTTPITVTFQDNGSAGISGFDVRKYSLTISSEGGEYWTSWSTNFDTAPVARTRHTSPVTYSNEYISNARQNYVGWYDSDNSGGSGGGGSDPVYPPYPTPPEPDNPTVPSEPTNITINWGDINYTSNQTTTTTVDLQPILDAIRIVNDNLESGFLGLEADIRSCYDGMEQLLTSWFEYFGSWFQTISTQLDTWYRLFLKELRTANSWLRAIYYKSFGGNSSQPDVTSDTDGYWNWLYELLARIIEMLPDSLQEIITQLAQLQNYFPFSVPWDIAFLLGLLDAQPVTPVIHGYLPTWGANGFVAQGVPLDIDLTEFDDIALLLRRAELIFFAITLLPTTYDVLKGFREVLHS